jgi:glycosyltransferase involved in cell wall biosynthesis
MKEIEVSVIMPTLNVEQYVTEAIESVLNQTFKNFEFNILDGGSKDNTIKIVNMYLKKDNRVKFYSFDNLGLIDTRQKGILLSRGKYIAWQDADDISYTDRLELQYEYLKENPEVGAVGGYLDFYCDKIKKIIGVRKYYPDDYNLRKRIFLFCPVAQPVAMIRKEAIEKVGNYNKKFLEQIGLDNERGFPEDLEMWFKIGLKYKFANIDKPLLRYRLNSTNSVTNSHLRRMELATIKVRMWYGGQNIGYRMSLLDKLYCLTMYLSIYLIPSKIKIRLFNYFRNSKKIISVD